MSDSNNSEGNGLILRGPRELKRWSGALIRRGLAEVVPGTNDNKAESLAIHGSIFDAAMNGDTGGVRAILSIDPTKANARDADNDWWTPLHYAAEAGHIPIIEILLAYGADINAQTGEEIENLTEDGIKQTWRDPGKTPLLLSCFANRSEAAKLMIQRSADVNLADSFDYAPLHASAVNGNFELTEILLLHGAIVDVIAHCGSFSEEFGCERGFAPLHIAARNGHSELVDLLLSKCAAVDIQDSWRRTPLMFAARMGHLQTVETLLDAGANANEKSLAEPTRINRTGIGTTPLFYAVEGGNEEIVGKLLDEDADINDLNEWAESPLHFAAADGLTQIAELLLDNGAVINKQDIHGMKPLDRAISAGQAKTADMISEYFHSGFAFDQVQAKALQMLCRINGFASDRTNHLTELVIDSLIDDSGGLQNPRSNLDQENFDVFLELAFKQPRGTEKGLFKVLNQQGGGQVPDNLEALPAWAEFLVLLLLDDRGILTC